MFPTILIIKVIATLMVALTSANNTRLVCEQSPIDLGIVFDSSLSVTYKAFIDGKQFLRDLIELYNVGTGPRDVRVSVISFGRGIYPDDAFNLTTYTTKGEVLKAIEELPHRYGRGTYTFDGIDYMANVQLSRSVARATADRVGVVITDGRSTYPDKTKEAAARARDSGITLIAVGVGSGVKHDELVTIAGKESRVLKVGNYTQLQNIMGKLADLICYHEPVPTTPPPPLCPRSAASNVYFVASPAELGINGNGYIVSLMSETKRQPALAHNYSLHLFTGNSESCMGRVALDFGDSSNFVGLYESITPKLADIAMQLVNSTTTNEAVRNVAVLVVMDRGGLRSDGLEQAIQALRDKDFKVYILKPYRRYTGKLHSAGAVVLQSRTARTASTELTSEVCGSK